MKEKQFDELKESIEQMKSMEAKQGGYMSRQEQKTKMLMSIAKGYCTKRNENKILDPDLAADMVDFLIDDGFGDKDRFTLDYNTIDVFIKPIEYKEE